MRWLLRGALALVAVLTLALVALLVVLPRLAESEGVRERIQAASRNALGRDVDYASIGVGLLPPSLQLEKPRVSGESPDAPPLARAESIELRAGLLALLRGELQVRSLVADGFELNLVRTADGFVLPGPARDPEGEAAPGESGGGSEEGGAPAGSGRLPVDVRRVLLRDAHLVVEDRSVQPTQTWDLRDLQLDARPDGSGIDVVGSTRLADGGELALTGRADLEGESDLSLELRDFALAALGPYLGERVAGILGGRLKLRGPTADPALEAELSGVDVAYGETVLSGPVELEAQLESLSELRGPFTLVLDDAAYAGSGLSKPAGTRARLSGTLGADAAGKTAIDDLRLALHNLEASGHLRTAPRTALTLNAQPFELEGWERLIPALSLAAPSGRLSASELVVSSAPLEARGTLELLDVLLRPSGRPPVNLAGQIELLGDALQSRELAVGAADQRFDVDARIDSLFATPRYQVGFQTAPDGAEVNALLAAFAGQPDKVFGPLVGGGTLRGTLGGDTDFLSALDGELEFGIEQGRIVGASLIEGVLGPLGAKLAELGRDRAGGDLERFYGESFESLEAALRIENGQALARPLTLDYQGYSTTLEGPVSLVDLVLDLRGSLTVHEELDAELAQAFGAGSDYTPRRRTLQLAAVRGTLGDPKVQLAGGAVRQIASAYAVDAYKDDLRKKVEDELGPGTGEIVERGLGVLDGLLGRRRSEAPEAPAESAPPEAAPDPPPPVAAESPSEAPAETPPDAPTPAPPEG